MSIEEFLFSDKTVEEYLQDEEREPLYFDEAWIKERWNKLFSYGGSNPKDRISIYDSSHAEERLAQRFPDVTWSDFKKIVADGLKVIKNQYAYEQNFYMIISRGTNVKVQLDVRPDRMTGETIGVIATVLNAKEQPWNKNKEIGVFVEQAKKDSKGGLLRFDEEGDSFFTHFFEDGEYFKTFVTVEVD